MLLDGLHWSPRLSYNKKIRGKYHYPLRKLHAKTSQFLPFWQLNPSHFSQITPSTEQHPTLPKINSHQIINSNPKQRILNLLSRNNTSKNLRVHLIFAHLAISHVNPRTLLTKKSPSTLTSLPPHNTRKELRLLD